MGRVLPIRGSISNYHNHTMGAAQPPKIIAQKNMHLAMERGSRGRKQFLKYRLHSIFYTLKIDTPALCMETQLGRWSGVIAGREITGSLDSSPHTFQQRRHEMDCDLIGAKTQAQRRKRAVSGSCGQRGGLGRLPGGRAWGSNSLGLARRQVHTGTSSHPCAAEDRGSFWAAAPGRSGRPAGDRWRRAICHKDTFLLAALQNFSELKTFP